MAHASLQIILSIYIAGFVSSYIYMYIIDPSSYLNMLNSIRIQQNIVETTDGFQVALKNSDQLSTGMALQVLSTQTTGAQRLAKRACDSKDTQTASLRQQTFLPLRCPCLLQAVLDLPRLQRPQSELTNYRPASDKDANMRPSTAFSLNA